MLCIPGMGEPGGLRPMGSYRGTRLKRLSSSSTLCFVAQLCLTLCDPVNCSPPATVAHQQLKPMELLQARILEWVAVPSSRGSSQPRARKQGSCTVVILFTVWARSPRILEWVAYPFSRGSSRHRNWIGVSCIAGGFFTSWATREAHLYLYLCLCLCLYLICSSNGLDSKETACSAGDPGSVPGLGKSPAKGNDNSH